MKQFLDLGQRILDEGTASGDRTGTGTVKIFGTQMDFYMASGYPMVTTTQGYFKSMVGELLAFLEGSQDNHRYHELKCKFWDHWSTADGRNGAPYGLAWRAWKTADGRVIDQIAELIHGLRTRPESRRHLVSAWDPAMLPDETKSPQQNVLEGRSSLAACHCMFQVFAEKMSFSQRILSVPTELVDEFIDRSQISGAKAALSDMQIQEYRLSLKVEQR